MPRFPGNITIIEDTPFLDNVLLVSGGEPSRAASFLRNRGFGSGAAVIIGDAVIIHTTPAIEVQDVEAPGRGAVVAAVLKPTAMAPVALAPPKPKRKAAKKPSPAKRSRP